MKKVEYDGYTTCKSYKTAYNRLAKIMNSMTDNTGLDSSYFESLKESFGKDNDIHEYFKNEDGSLFRLTIEQLDENYFYIDCCIIS